MAATRSSIPPQADIAWSTAYVRLAQGDEVRGSAAVEADTPGLGAIRLAGRAICTNLQPFDIFITPTLTQLPRPLGYFDMSIGDIDRYHAKWTDAAFMYPFNISGQPATSLPLHWSSDGLAHRGPADSALRRRGRPVRPRHGSRTGDAVAGSSSAASSLERLTIL